MSTSEFLWVKASGKDNKFLTITKTRKVSYSGTTPDEPSLERGFYRVDYDGPVFKTFKGGVTAKAFRNMPGHTGWTLRTESVENVWRILGDEVVQKLFKSMPNIEIVSAGASSPALVVDVLQMCENAESLKLTVRSRFPDQTDFIRPMVRLPHLRRLTAIYPRPQATTTKKHEPRSILEFLDVSHIVSLSLRQVPISSRLMLQLCDSKLKNLYIENANEKESKLVFAVMDKYDVQLNNLTCSSMAIPEGLSSSSLEHVTSTTVEAMSPASIIHLLGACEKEMHVLTLQYIIDAKSPPKELFDAIASGCPKLERLRIYHWATFGNSHHRMFCDTWGKSGRKRLKEVQFDEGCQLSFRTLNEPFYLSDWESSMAETMSMIPSSNERWCISTATTGPKWKKAKTQEDVTEKGNEKDPSKDANSPVNSAQEAATPASSTTGSVEDDALSVSSYTLL